ncbi:MAG TPA: HAMP domain-containing sensor histidine kinase [Oscillospiraceae bacterium]|nr:HAMP domain-containing sensor histidine kinase [Oscillospiraceae bacterium]HRW56715.1 HAMP domain-containing sensor histidine kinase [Oscillospiraceae bacterium]
MAIKKITRRWLFNSLGVILVILIAVVVAVAVAIHNNYYDGVSRRLMSQAETITSLLAKYYAEGEESYDENVRSMVSTFKEKDVMELMALDKDGNVVITSSGFLPSAGLSMPDYEEALASSDGSGDYTGVIGGEKVMAITRVPQNSTDRYHAFRLVVSLEKVDMQVYTLIAVTSFVGMAIIFFVVFSSSYFINSIVIPVGQVGDAARRIAEGNFGEKLQKRTDDEIGDLCDTINDMADELGATERMKNEFISSVSHELRTPLTAIKGWAETIEDSTSDGSVDPEMLHKGMGVIISETERLSVMVEELLDFSRLESGRMVLQPMMLDIIAELYEAVLTFEQRAKREEKELIFEDSDDVITVWGDRNRLRQVFVNIIDNALKYSDAGGKITVHASQSKIEGFTEVTVTDTGCGIPANQLDKVKTKFYKGNATRKGSGIGLAVADEIVRMHGGALLIESKEGVGTKVTVRLPENEARAAAAIAAAQKMPERQRMPSGKEPI